MKRIPHQHQVKILEKLKQSLLAGKRRPMIHCPTGGGKTFLAAMIVEGALKKGNRVIFTVPAISLIDQTVQAFWDEGIEDVGVIQANHYLTNYSKPVQVASMQTLMRRDMQGAKIIIIDEAHQDFSYVNEWMEALPDSIFIGLSATPWTKGLGKRYDDLIIGETTQGLIDKGILCPFKVFAPAHPDLSGVRTLAGDYHEGDLSKVMQEGGLIGEIVHTWLQLAHYRPTLCFAVDCAHARKIQEKFTHAGVPCGYIDAKTDRQEREVIRQQFERGEIRVVCNVGCLTTGIDWDVRCIILARPTKSTMLYCQAIGRGLRTAPGKDHCIILDHSDTTLRLGFVTDIHYSVLDDGKKSKPTEIEKKEILPKECPKCNFVKKVRICPNCGFETSPARSDIKEHFGDLQEVTKVKRYSMAEKQTFFSEVRGYVVKHKKNPKMAVAMYKRKFNCWPKGIDQETAKDPSPETVNYIRSRMIAYAKRKNES